MVTLDSKTLQPINKIKMPKRKPIYKITIPLPETDDPEERQRNRGETE